MTYATAQVQIMFEGYILYLAIRLHGELKLNYAPNASETQLKILMRCISNVPLFYYCFTVSSTEAALGLPNLNYVQVLS